VFASLRTVRETARRRAPALSHRGPPHGSRWVEQDLVHPVVVVVHHARDVVAGLADRSIIGEGHAGLVAGSASAVSRVYQR